MTESKESTNKPNAPEQEADQSVLNRRQFIGFGASAAAAALAFPKAAQAYAEFPEMKHRAIKIAQNGTSTPPASASTSFPQPKVESFINRANPLELNISQINLEVDNPGSDPITVEGARVYNESAPGPTLKVNSGDTISINLNNNLSSPGTRCPAPPNPSQPWEDNCYNNTNMHFHGLHVSPSSIYDGPYEPGKLPIKSSDDVLVDLDPGKKNYPYCVVLPDFHAPGTHWYHAHRHGSTAVEASSGMVGAIIVTNPDQPELTPAIPEEQDLVFVMQEIVDAASEQSVYTSKGAFGGGTAGQFLINGELEPTLTIEKGKIMRWRFINGTATPRGFAKIKLCPINESNSLAGDCNDAIPMNLIAVDGILFYGHQPQPQTEWMLSPGNRADFLVQFSDTGRYKIIKDVVPGVNAAGIPQVLAYVQVTDSDAEPETMPTLASTPPDYLKPINDGDIIVKDQPIVFSVVSGQTVARNGEFLMDNERYDMNCFNHEVTLNTKEEWTLQNSSNVLHPFHIHVNPFQLQGDKIDPDGPDDWTNYRWWDTIAVGQESTKENQGGIGTRVIRHRFTNYPGEFVIHCHILVHEDLGMMQNIVIKDDGTGVGPCCNVAADGSSSCDNPPIITGRGECSNFS